MVVSALGTLLYQGKFCLLLELKSLFFPHMLSTNAAVGSKNSNSIWQLIAAHDCRQFAAQDFCRGEGHCYLFLLQWFFFRWYKLIHPIHSCFYSGTMSASQICQCNFFFGHVMNYIQAQIWIKGNLLSTQYCAVGPAKMTEGFRNGHCNVDHKASLLFLLLVDVLKGFTPQVHHCSVTSCKHFYSVNVGELWQNGSKHIWVGGAAAVCEVLCSAVCCSHWTFSGGCQQQAQPWLGFPCSLVWQSLLIHHSLSVLSQHA